MKRKMDGKDRTPKGGAMGARVEEYMMRKDREEITKEIGGVHVKIGGWALMVKRKEKVQTMGKGREWMSE